MPYCCFGCVWSFLVDFVCICTDFLNEQTDLEIGWSGFSSKRIFDHTLGGVVYPLPSPGGLSAPFCEDPLQPLTCPRPLTNHKKRHHKFGKNLTTVCVLKIVLCPLDLFQAGRGGKSAICCFFFKLNRTLVLPLEHSSASHTPPTAIKADIK